MFNMFPDYHATSEEALFALANEAQRAVVVAAGSGAYRGNGSGNGSGNENKNGNEDASGSKIANGGEGYVDGIRVQTQDEMQTQQLAVAQTTRVEVASLQHQLRMTTVHWERREELLRKREAQLVQQLVAMERTAAAGGGGGGGGGRSIGTQTEGIERVIVAERIHRRRGGGKLPQHQEHQEAASFRAKPKQSRRRAKRTTARRTTARRTTARTTRGGTRGGTRGATRATHVTAPATAQRRTTAVPSPSPSTAASSMGSSSVQTLDMAHHVRSFQTPLHRGQTGNDETGSFVPSIHSSIHNSIDSSGCSSGRSSVPPENQEEHTWSPLSGSPRTEQNHQQQQQQQQQQHTKKIYRNGATIPRTKNKRRRRRRRVGGEETGVVGEVGSFGSIRALHSRVQTNEELSREVKEKGASFERKIL